MSRIETYQVGDEWVIADGSGWRPGAYDTEETARYAHRLGYPAMEQMWDAWSAENRAIGIPAMTRADVQAWKARGENAE